MNVHLSSGNLGKSIQYVDRQKSLISILLSKQRINGINKKDFFIKSNDSMVGLGLYSTYEKKEEGNLSNAILDMINFEYRDCKQETAYSFRFGGVEYYKADIPKISADRCLDIKAENNAIVFQTGKYYKFSDVDGKNHVLSCSYDRIGQPYSDTSRGIVDDISYNIGKFWNMLARDGTYISLYYSHDMQRQILNDAGITEGFFSVQVGSNKQEYYYSNGQSGVAVPKSRYDDAYNMLAVRGSAIFNEYEVGSVFKIGGKEYTLNADKKLDIPYGVDIFDIEFPPRSSIK